MQFIKAHSQQIAIRRGENIGNSKLTEDQVKMIRESNQTSRLLAKIYDVSIGCIDAVRTGKTWKHVK